ncbi:MULTISPECIES: hypothetical protein [Pseudomonas]|nr:MULTISPECIES: hypothetical protein [Pseudomonas]
MNGFNLFERGDPRRGPAALPRVGVTGPAQLLKTWKPKDLEEHRP